MLTLLLTVTFIVLAFVNRMERRRSFMTRTCYVFGHRWVYETSIRIRYSWDGRPRQRVYYNVFCARCRVPSYVHEREGEETGALLLEERVQRLTSWPRHLIGLRLASVKRLAWRFTRKPVIDDIPF